MNTLFYSTFQSLFGTFSIVWKSTELNIKLQRIFLSNEVKTSDELCRENFKDIKTMTLVQIEKIGNKIKKFLSGEDIQFNLAILDFSKCTELHKKVLLAEYDIPRGKVSTYKRIASHSGIKNGARVVGNSLVRNPFPIIIPCHRAIRSDGTLGGFQGGINMKRKLLKQEGIQFTKNGKVVMDEIYY